MQGVAFLCPLSQVLSAMREIKYLVLHTTAGNRNWLAEDVQRYFLETKQWKMGGYHWLVEMSGKPKRIYLDEQVTNGVLPYRGEGIDIRNSNSVHVSWIGGIDGAGQATDNRTWMQKNTLEQLVHFYLAKYPHIQILGHNQAARKACPCFFVPDFCEQMDVPEANIHPEDPFGYRKP